MLVFCWRMMLGHILASFFFGRWSRKQLLIALQLLAVKNNGVDGQLYVALELKKDYLNQKSELLIHLIMLHQLNKKNHAKVTSELRKSRREKKQNLQNKKTSFDNSFWKSNFMVFFSQTPILLPLISQIKLFASFRLRKCRHLSRFSFRNLLHRETMRSGGWNIGSSSY